MAILPWRRAPHFPYGHPPAGMDVLWTCDAKSYAYVVDPDRDEWGSTPPRIELRWEEIERRTPKGAYLKHHYRDDFALRQFVPLWARRRRYANTPEEALSDFIGRSSRYAYILKRKLRRCEEELALAQSIDLTLGGPT